MLLCAFLISSCFHNANFQIENDLKKHFFEKNDFGGIFQNLVKAKDAYLESFLVENYILYIWKDNKKFV